MLIGESGAGKSSVLTRFTKNSFTSSTVSTIAVDFQIKQATIADKQVAIQIWDTAGQEKYFTITTSYYRQADGIVLVYDKTDGQALTKVEKWYPRFPCRLSVATS
jgi:Ras-related protein Rab-1A